MIRAALPCTSPTRRLSCASAIRNESLMYHRCAAKGLKPSLLAGYCFTTERRLPCAGPCRARAGLRAGKRRAAPARDFGPAATRLGRAPRRLALAAALADRAGD